jgi:hypothetical protein
MTAAADQGRVSAAANGDNNEEKGASSATTTPGANQSGGAGNSDNREYRPDNRAAWADSRLAGDGVRSDGVSGPVRLDSDPPQPGAIEAVVTSGVTDPAPAPQVANATDSDRATGSVTVINRAKWGPNVREFPRNATGGAPPVAKKVSNYTQKDLPEIKWFTFERRKASTNTWAYCVRWYRLDHATGKYNRVAPITVRRVSDATDTVLRKRDNATLKNLVRTWYEQKIGQQFVSAG